MDALLLPVGEEWYAIDLAVVREVVPAPAVTPLPGAPESVLGVVNLRGEVVPVFDTGTLIGVGPAPPDHLVVIETPAGPGALSVTAQPQAVELGASAGPSELASGRGRYAVGIRVVTLLDPAQLLSPDRIALAP